LRDKDEHAKLFRNKSNPHGRNFQTGVADRICQTCHVRTGCPYLLLFLTELMRRRIDFADVRQEPEPIKLAMYCVMSFQISSDQMLCRMQVSKVIPVTGGGGL
jgi:hypothetical protein